MAKLSEIKQKNPELNFSLIDFLTLVDTSDTNKFVPMMINCINSEFKKRISSREIQFNNLRMDKIKSKFLESKKDLNYIEPFIDFFNHILLDTCGKDIILDFMDLYQRNYVENLDLNTISDLDQLREIYNKAHSKFIANTSHKEVVKVVDDQEWLIVRPLTYESSRAYGAGTKWCTTSKDNPHHFFRYYSRGILIYCINKITGYKVAVFWDVNDESSPTFWNVLDIQIDSMMTELPPYILKHIKNLPKTSNASLCDKKTLEINRQYEIETKLLSLEPDHEVENMAGVEDNFNGD